MIVLVPSLGILLFNNITPEEYEQIVDSSRPLSGDSFI